MDKEEDRRRYKGDLNQTKIKEDEDNRMDWDKKEMHEGNI